MEKPNNLNPDRIPFLISKYWAGQYNYVIAGINEDDCSILEIEGSQIVITSDFLNARPIAVELGLAGLFELGRLVVASNMADLCGSGATPLAMMLCTMMSRSTTETDYLKLIDGVKYELDKVKIPLIGGDTKFGKTTSLLGTAIGYRAKDAELYLKNRARPNDIIWVSGEIGSVSAAVDGYNNYQSKLSSEWLSWGKTKLIEPSLPLQKSSEISRLKIGNAGTDISDGLGADLIDLCIASKVGCVINVDKIPVNPNIEQIARIRNVPNWTYALLIGGDFQFIVTTSENHRDIMINCGFHEIGYITDSKQFQMQIDSKLHELPNHGHEDGRQLSFGDEVDLLLSKISYKQ